MAKEVVKAPENLISPNAIEKLIALLQEIDYGSVTLIIHDGKLVQIEKNEKIRLK